MYVYISVLKRRSTLSDTKTPLLPTFYKILSKNVAQPDRPQTIMYRCADKSLARPGRKQANVSVRMA